MLYKKKKINQKAFMNELLENKYANNIVKLKCYKKGEEITFINDKYIGFLKRGVIAESIYGTYLLKKKNEFINLGLLFSGYNKKSQPRAINITNSEILWIDKKYINEFISVNPLFIEMLIEEINTTYHRTIEGIVYQPKNINYLDYVENILRDISSTLDLQSEFSVDKLFEVCRVPQVKKEQVINSLREKNVIKICPNGYGKIVSSKEITVG